MIHWNGNEVTPLWVIETKTSYDEWIPLLEGIFLTRRRARNFLRKIKGMNPKFKYDYHIRQYVSTDLRG